MIPLAIFRSLRRAVPCKDRRQALLRAGLYTLFLWKDDHWEVDSAEFVRRLLA